MEFLMDRTFYITPNKTRAGLFEEGKCYPVLSVIPTDLGSVIKLLVAGDDGQLFYTKASDVSFAGFDLKEDAEINELIEQPVVMKNVTPAKGKK